MTQFRQKWKYTSDNVKYAEMIEKNHGKFFTLDATPYVERLDEFCIFYTMTLANNSLLDT
jgi:hypothetical protein